MKFIQSTFTVSLLIIWLGLAVNGYSQTFLTNGLVAYYPFKGNTSDASGNGNNLLLLAGNFTTDRFGSPQSAIQFTNAVPLTGPLVSSQIQSPLFTFSLCAWFRASQPAALIGFGSAQTSQSFQADRNLSVTQSNQLYFYVFPGQQEFAIATNVFAFNKWHSAVATLSSAGMRLYFDGLLVTNNPSVTSAQNYNGYWHIGMDVGEIDDVRIYNRALSDSEVQQLYVYESGPMVNLIKAVKPSFSNLTLTTNYQLQVSADLNTWTNQGSAFAATNTSMIYPQYWDVDNWNKLFFRLQVSP